MMASNRNLLFRLFSRCHVTGQIILFHRTPFPFCTWPANTTRCSLASMKVRRDSVRHTQQESKLCENDDVLPHLWVSHHTFSKRWKDITIKGNSPSIHCLLMWPFAKKSKMPCLMASSRPSSSALLAMSASVIGTLGSFASFPRILFLKGFDGFELFKFSSSSFLRASCSFVAPCFGSFFNLEYRFFLLDEAFDGVYYFTNLDFHEIQGPISLPNSYLLGPNNSWKLGRDDFWPDPWDKGRFTHMNSWLLCFFVGRYTWYTI